MLARFWTDFRSNFAFRAACEEDMAKASKNSFKRAPKRSKKQRKEEATKGTSKTNSPSSCVVFDTCKRKKNKANECVQPTCPAMIFGAVFQPKKTPKTVQKTPRRPTSRQEGLGEALGLDFEAMLVPCAPPKRHPKRSKTPVDVRCRFWATQGPGIFLASKNRKKPGANAYPEICRY